MGHASGCVVSSFSLLLFLPKEWRKRKVHQGLTAQFGKTIVRILAIRIDMHILAQLK
jgi:hypothetical protein